MVIVVEAAAARGLGAHNVVRYDHEDLVGMVMEFTDGRGADVVYDPVGGDHFRDAIRATGFLGRILIVGFASGSAPSIGMNIALVKGISLVGVDFGRYIRERPNLAAEVHAELVELWEGEVLDDLTSQVLALEDLLGVHTRFTDREVIGKWVVRL